LELQAESNETSWESLEGTTGDGIEKEEGSLLEFGPADTRTGETGKTKARYIHTLLSRRPSLNLKLYIDKLKPNIMKKMIKKQNTRKRDI